MKNMSPREKTILIITIVVIIVGVAFRMGLDQSIMKIVSGRGQESAAQRTYEKNLKQLEDIVTVTRQYNSLGQSPLDKGAESRPFEEFVVQIARKNGFEYPTFRSEVDDIEGAEEYEYQIVSLRTEGTFANTVKLLKDFDANGMLLREVDIRSTRDRDLMVGRITIARVARRAQRQVAEGGQFDN